MTVEADIPRWIKQLRELAKLTTKDIDAIELDLLEAVKRDRRAGRVTFTGFPSNTSGGGNGGGPKLTVDGEEIPCTGVEKAAIDPAPLKDPLHDHVWDTIGALHAAALGTGLFTARIKKLRALTRDVPHVQWCEACSPAGVLHEPDRYARDMRGIDHPMHLCDAASRFIENHGRPPTDEEAKHYDLKGRWKVRVDPTRHGVTKVRRAG